MNRLYVPRKLGGRGLTLIEDMYTLRNIILADHLQKQKTMNRLLAKAAEHEEKNIIRLGFELRAELGLQTEGNINRERVKNKLKQKHLEAWRNKPMHSYVFKKVETGNDIDAQASHNWMNTGISSHVEGYVITLQKQEIATRATIKCRDKGRNNETICRLCKSQEETVFHVLGSCSSLSSNLYLATRHDNIARELVCEIANVEKPKNQRGIFPVVSNTAT